jgi:hypothetical protein
MDLAETLFSQELAQVGGKIALQRFFAGHKSEAARELLCHQMARLSQLLFVGFRNKIFDDEFSR